MNAAPRHHDPADDAPGTEREPWAPPRLERLQLVDTSKQYSSIEQLLTTVIDSMSYTVGPS